MINDRVQLKNHKKSKTFALGLNLVEITFMFVN